jgi:hypothetical protein
MGRKKKQRACPTPAPADAERRVAQPAAEFGLGLGDMERYVARNTLRLGEDDDPRARAYLNPAGARYVVVAVDTAAGGENSDEAFVVFLPAFCVSTCHIHVDNPLEAWKHVMECIIPDVSSGCANR